MRMVFIDNENQLHHLKSIWTDFANETSTIYRDLDMGNLKSKFYKETEAYDVITLLLIEDSTPLGFASGVVMKYTETAYITCVIIDKYHRRKGFGRELLSSLEEKMIHHNGSRIKKFEFVFHNPVNLEWVVPNTDQHDHPNAPGVDMNSDGHKFLKNCGYHDYAYQNSYYLQIEQYEFTTEIKSKITRLNATDITVTYYNEKIHYGFDDLFNDLKSESWREIINKNNSFPNGGNPVLIAERKGKIIGFTGPLHLQESMRGYFAGIGIHSEARGYGVGSILFASLCMGLKDLGAKYMTLFTGDNNPARKIYEKEGFKIVKSWVNMRKDVRS